MGFVFLTSILYNTFCTKEGFLDMESITLKGFIKERVEENKDLFTEEELKVITENRDCFYKVYLLGAVNSKDCYEKKEF